MDWTIDRRNLIAFSAAGFTVGASAGAAHAGPMAPVRDGTAVDAGDRTFETNADHLFDGLANALLYGMLGKFIMIDGLAEMAGGQKHRGMFAGTVVVKRRRIHARTQERALVVDAERQLGA
jgi:hypothetical protein